ncbi:MAG: MCP four helix bundle domain-containing protein [Perlabentimonas sp.]
MKKKLKLKILAGFMLLVALLMVAGTVSIFEFLKLSNSVTALIEDNYKTIEASKSMLEALERKDSGILLFLLGDEDKGREVVLSGDKAFSKAFETAINNVTETNESDYIESIERSYKQFSSNAEMLVANMQQPEDLNLYYGEIHQSFIEVKDAVNELMGLNQTSMYEEAYELKEKSHRAIMPGIIAIIGALVFSLLLSFFISKYFVSPLSSLAEAIKNFQPKDKELKIKIKSNDEIKKIESEVNNLIYRLKKQ